jgi:hypothetical protein
MYNQKNIRTDSINLYLFAYKNEKLDQIICLSV